MTFAELFGKIGRYLPDLERKDLLSVANEVIGNINGKYPGKFIIETALTRKTIDEELDLTLDAAAKTITAARTVNFATQLFVAGQIIYIIHEDLASVNNTPLTISSLGDIGGGTNNVITVKEDIEDATITAAEITGYEITSGYTWDHTNKILTMPSYVKETLDLRVDTSDYKGLAFENKTIPSVEGTSNQAEARYYMITNYEAKFTSLSLDAVDQAIRVEMIKRIPNMTSVVPETTIDIPVDLESTLLAGCFFYIMTRPPNDQDRFENMAKTNREVFIAGLFDAVNVEDDSRPSSDISPEFVYNNDE